MLCMKNCICSACLTHSFDRQTLPIFTILKTKKGPRNLDYYITIGGDVKIAQYADPYALFFSSSH